MIEELAGKLVVTGVGLIMLIVGVYQIIKQKKNTRGYIETDAVFVDYTFCGQSNYSYIFEFKTQNGKVIRGKEIGLRAVPRDGIPRYTGVKTKVNYDPNNPSRFYHSNAMPKMKLGFLMIAVAGIVYILLGLLVV